MYRHFTYRMSRCYIIHPHTVEILPFALAPKTYIQEFWGLDQAALDVGFRVWAGYSTSPNANIHSA